MSTSTSSSVERSQASIAAAALCNNFDLLISDYGILTGAFPLENSAIKSCFVSQGIITSMELTELDDEARKLKSRIEKDEKKNKYRDTPRERHERTRKDLEKTFADLVMRLKDLKVHLESSFRFKYLPNCTYRLLGEVGKPPAQRDGLPRNIHQPPIQGIATARSSHVISEKIQSAAVDSNRRELYAEQVTPERSPAQPLQLIKKRSVRSRKPALTSDNREPSISSGSEIVKTIKKSSRPRRLTKMGIAGRIANKILDFRRFDHPFGMLAPEVNTPQQIWEHRFPDGYTRPDIAIEYTRTLEQLLAASNRKIKMMPKKRKLKELSAAKAKNRKLTEELDAARKEIQELGERNTVLAERQGSQNFAITKTQMSGSYYTTFHDPKSNTKRKHRYNEPAYDDNSGRDASQDTNTSAKRQRIS
ncbi:hypothetical protein BKA64DRAFT_708095 [Cadophora sp. MPI-SDFR-AT-0126]|nr:hypothetical protein BKA64DRAFT_708095 [Leotiomycetes sp. MPI-SDFR-AT-0126]